MKLPALFALVAALTGAGTYFGATAGGSTAQPRAIAAVMHRDATPTAEQFARALAGSANQLGGDAITKTHCVKAAPGHYMCAYTVERPTGSECHLMQGMWTPGEASTITVTLAGRSGRCDSVRAAIQSLH